MSYQGNYDKGSNGSSQSHGTESLIVLSSLLKNIIVPLEKQKTDNMMTTIKKFASNIDHTIQQVTGSISIQLPPKDDLSDRVAIKNKELMMRYEGLLVFYLSELVFLTFFIRMIGLRKLRTPSKLRTRKSLKLITLWEKSSFGVTRALL